MHIIDPNLIMVKSVIGLYLNGQLENPNLKLKKTISKILKTVKLPTNVEGEGSVGDIARGLKLTLEWLENIDVKEVPAIDVMTRIKLNCVHEHEYIDVIKDRLENKTFEQEELRKSTASIQRELDHELTRVRYSQLFRDGNRKVNFSVDEFDFAEFAREFRESLEDIVIEEDEVEPEALAGILTTSDKESVKEVLENSKVLVSEEGVMKTPYKGLNEALGVGGLQAGFSYCFPALSHNYKTGILLDLSRGIPQYNKPHLTDEGKKKKLKPLMLRMSFENKLEQDLPVVYKSIREAEEQRKIDITTIDVNEAADYIVEKLTANGWEVAFECWDPNTLDVWDIIERLNYYESKGYEVKLCVIDYLGLVTKQKGQMRKDQAITYAFEVLRNHCFPKGITVATAHQLSTEAQKISREGTVGLAARLASNGYYEDCQSLATKLDCEMVLSIFKQGDQSYLTFARGKHRGGEETPVKKRTFAYKFTEFGLEDDVNCKKSKALYQIPGMSGASVTGASASDDEMW